MYQRGGGIGWEYDFPFSGGRAPWLSGMAQAVAAQAFSRAATTVPEEATTYMNEATAAFRVIPKRLMTSVAAGPWIRLYAFSSLTVLNAQLQATISLEAYATASGDAQAQTLATRMQNAAAASLGRFDTGYWSYYALPREPSPPDYHHYVVQLLTKLKTADPRFADAATRFAAYEKEPPAFQLANGGVGQVRVLALEAGHRRRRDAAGPTKRLAAARRVAHVHVAAEARGRLPRAHHARRTGTATRSRSMRRRSCASAAARSTPVKPSTDDDTGAPALVVANRATPSPGRTARPRRTRHVVAEAAATPLRRCARQLSSSLTPRYRPRSFAQYAAALAQQLPNLAYLTIGPAPTARPRRSTSQPSRRCATRCKRSCRHAVGMVIDGAAAPKQTVAALGKAGATADVLAFRAGTGGGDRRVDAAEHHAR